MARSPWLGAVVAVVVGVFVAALVLFENGQRELLRLVYEDQRLRRWPGVRSWDATRDGGIGQPVSVVDGVLTEGECSVVRDLLSNPSAIDQHELGSSSSASDDHDEQPAPLSMEDFGHSGVHFHRSSYDTNANLDAERRHRELREEIHERVLRHANELFGYSEGDYHKATRGGRGNGGGGGPLFIETTNLVQRTVPKWVGEFRGCKQLDDRPPPAAASLLSIGNAAPRFLRPWLRRLAWRGGGGKAFHNDRCPLEKGIEDYVATGHCTERLDHCCPWRTHSALLYLESGAAAGYRGGDLVVVTPPPPPPLSSPNNNATHMDMGSFWAGRRRIEPRCGRLVLMDATVLHAVTAVEAVSSSSGGGGGDCARSSLAMWLTSAKDYGLGGTEDPATDTDTDAETEAGITLDAPGPTTPPASKWSSRYRPNPDIREQVVERAAESLASRCDAEHPVYSPAAVSDGLCGAAAARQSSSSSSSPSSSPSSSSSFSSSSSASSSSSLSSSSASSASLVWMTENALLVDDFLTPGECARLQGASFRHQLHGGGNYANESREELLKDTMDAVGLLSPEEVAKFVVKKEGPMARADRLLMLDTLTRLLSTVRHAWPESDDHPYAVDHDDHNNNDDDDGDDDDDDAHYSHYSGGQAASFPSPHSLWFDHAELQVKREGSLLRPHSDQCDVEEDPDTGKRFCVERDGHCCAWREVTAFLYLSSSTSTSPDFDGGELEFPEWSFGDVSSANHGDSISISDLLPDGVHAPCSSSSSGSDSAAVERRSSGSFGVCIQPRCGRLVAFSSRGLDNIHAVRNVTRGSRTAIGSWFTRVKERAREVPVDVYSREV